MTPEEVKVVAEAAGAEAAKRIALDRESIRELVRETVTQTLVSIGVPMSDPIETQKDMQHLRAWRESMDSMKSKSMLTLLAIAVAGIAAMLWIGFKDLVSK